MLTQLDAVAGEAQVVGRILAVVDGLGLNRQRAGNPTFQLKQQVRANHAHQVELQILGPRFIRPRKGEQPARIDAVHSPGSPSAARS